MSKYDFTLNLKEENSLSKLITMVTPNSKILEFGPAHGRLTKFLKEEMACSIDIVEIDELAGNEAAEFANRAFVGQREGDIECYFWYEQLKDERYDYIIFADVLEHLYHPNVALTKSKELLENDGSILVSIPNIAHDAVLINLFYNKFRYTKTGLLDDTHVRFFAYDELESFFESAGLSIINFDTIKIAPEHTEQADFFCLDYHSIGEVLNKRNLGDIYQFVLNLRKKEYVNQNESDVYHEGKKRHIAQLYFNIGDGYNEQDKVTAPIDINDNPIKVHFSIGRQVNSLRFDPVEGFPCLVTIKDVRSDASIERLNPLNFNPCEELDEATDEFFTIDPAYNIVGEFDGMTYLEIEYNVVPISSLEAMEKLVLQQRFHENELANKEMQLNISQELLEQKQHLLIRNQEQLQQSQMLLSKKKDLLGNAHETLNICQNDLMIITNQLKHANINLQLTESQLAMVRMQLDTIENSASWRMTKPIRVTLDHVKHVITFLKKAIWYGRRRGVKATFNKCIEVIKEAYKKTDDSISNLTRDNLDHVEKTVSVIIPTKNAGDEFKLLLQSLIKQKLFNKIEIIVVDSGSNDETVKLARKYGAKIIEIEPKDFSHSYARNLGGSHASGDYLLFMTQDAMPQNDMWIHSLIKPIILTKAVASSCVEQPRDDCELAYAVNSDIFIKFMGLENGDRICSQPASLNAVDLRKNAQLNDVACLIRRDVFQKYQYRGDYAEDLDLGVRLIKDGYHIALLSSVKVIHSHNRPCGYYLKRACVDSINLKKILDWFPSALNSSDDIINGIAFGYLNLYRALDAILNTKDYFEKTSEFMTRIELLLEKYSELQYLNLGKTELGKTYSDRITDEFLEKILQHITKKTNKYNYFLEDIKNYLKTYVSPYVCQKHYIVGGDEKLEIVDLIYKRFCTCCGSEIGSYVNDKIQDGLLYELAQDLKKGV